MALKNYQERPADEVLKASQKQLGFMSLISKGQVKVWKAMLFSFFLAGFVGALTLAVGFNWGNQSQARSVGGGGGWQNNKPDLQSIDLEIISDSAPVMAGDHIEFHGQTFNDSDAYSPVSKSRFCLDNPNCLNSTNGQVGSDIQINWLAPNTVSPGFSAAWVATEGEHIIYLCADVEKTVNESDENNNCRQMAFTVEGVAEPQADLISYDLTSSMANPTAGDPIMFEAYIKNTGEATSNSFYSRFCVDNPDCIISTDGRIGNDHQHSGSEPGDIDRVQSDNWVAEVGTHSIFFCADVTGTVDETNEGNNCVKIDITVDEAPEADLISYDVGTMHGGAVTEGDKIEFTGIVENQGNTSSGYFYARLCVDNDNCMNSSQGQVGEAQYMDSLAPGSSNSLNSEAEWTATAGTHRVYLCADITKDVDESNESNNCDSYKFDVQGAVQTDPDLVTDEVFPDPMADMVEGEAIYFESSTTNIGSASSDSTFARYCIDNPNCYGTNFDGWINDDVTITALDPNQTDYHNSGDWIATVGDHTVYVCSDAPDYVDESNESNNCESASFNIRAVGKPDLVTGETNMGREPDILVEGDTINFESSTINNGESASVATFARYCIDNPNCYGTNFDGWINDDISVTALESGQTDYHSSDDWIAVAGDHTVYVCSDAPDYVDESYENNNCESYSFHVDPSPDLISQNLSLSDSTPIKGQQITFSGEVQNDGEGPARSSKARFCIDNSNCLNSTNGQVGSDQTVLNLYPGSSSSLDSNSWQAEQGWHHIYLCSDVSKIVNESDENNNCVTRKFFVDELPFN